MLYNNNLESIVFNRHQVLPFCDELVVISGYVGPAPIQKVSELPMEATVIYGMYGADGIGNGLHSILTQKDHDIDNLHIFYSTIPVHSKCYIWRYGGEIIHALIGSANFSTNGLTTPLKEVLAETTKDTFSPLNDYLKKIMECSIPCTMGMPQKNGNGYKKGAEPDEKWGEYNKSVCSLPLYIEENGIKKIPDKSGINWGMAKYSGSHVNINDAYLAINTDYIDHYPDLFPKKQLAPSDITSVARADHRHNDSVDIIWDDGTTMTGLLEGSVARNVNGVKSLYPKQLSTTPRKAELGKYIRDRIGVSEGKPITMNDLEKYGRNTIDISLQGEGIYYFDFSV